MSRISEKSPKHCATKHSLLNSHNSHKKLFLYLSTLLLTLLLFIFLVWLILRPTKPNFSIKRADINHLNLTRPSLLNSSIQLTIQSHNPNTKVGIYYVEFFVYASYNGQKITPNTHISPFYQDHEETNILTACLVGNKQIVGPSSGDRVQNDRRAGELVLDFEAFGKLRWKVGNWVSGHYKLNVYCVTNLPSGSSYTQGTKCSTKV